MGRSRGPFAVGSISKASLIVFGLYSIWRSTAGFGGQIVYGTAEDIQPPQSTTRSNESAIPAVA